MEFDTRLFNARQTLRGMELAGRQRYRDAEALIEKGRHYAAVYLAGYAIEVLLKGAYFRVAGAKADDDWVVLLPPARTFATSASGCGLARLELHNLDHWWLMYRGRRATPLDMTLRQQMARVVRWYRRNWKTEMRYLELAIRPDEAKMGLSLAKWLCENYASLR